MLARRSNLGDILAISILSELLKTLMQWENAIYNTYNRAITIHGVQYLRVEKNVAYNTMGHTFFIEDAIETNNYIDSNLAI